MVAPGWATGSRVVRRARAPGAVATRRAVTVRRRAARSAAAGTRTRTTVRPARTVLRVAVTRQVLLPAVSRPPTTTAHRRRHVPAPASSPPRIGHAEPLRPRRSRTGATTFDRPPGTWLAVTPLA